MGIERRSRCSFCFQDNSTLLCYVDLNIFRKTVGNKSHRIGWVFRMSKSLALFFLHTSGISIRSPSFLIFALPSLDCFESSDWFFPPFSETDTSAIMSLEHWRRQVTLSQLIFSPSGRLWTFLGVSLFRFSASRSLVRVVLAEKKGYEDGAFNWNAIFVPELLVYFAAMSSSCGAIKLLERYW